MSRRLLPLLLAVAACGNPDNFIVGAISAQGNAPVVVFDHINSAIHNSVLITKTNGDKLPATAILLSNLPDLCGALAKRPDYLKNPDEQSITMMILAPDDKVGTFILGRLKPDEGAVLYSAVLAAPGGAAATNLYPVSNGYTAVTEFDVGGEAKGSFDLVFFDGRNGNEFQGRYKTQACDALHAASLP